MRVSYLKKLIGILVMGATFILPGIAQSTVLNTARLCNAFPGLTAGAKIAACVANLPRTGGIADARGLDGAQTWRTCPFRNVTIPVTDMGGAATHSLSATCTFPANVTLDLAQGG